MKKKRASIIIFLSTFMAVSILFFFLYSMFDNPVQEIFNQQEQQLTEFDYGPQVEQAPRAKDFQQVIPEVSESIGEKVRSINFGQITTGLTSFLSFVALLLNIIGIQLKDIFKRKTAK